MKFKILMFILLSLRHSEMCSSLKILCVSPHFAKSHFAPSATLMKALASRGHEVDVISQFPQTAPIPNYTDIPVRPSGGFIVGNLTYTEVEKFHVANLKHMVEVSGPVVCELLGQPSVQNLLQARNHYDVIVVELFMAPCFLALGGHLNAPMIGLVTSKLHDWLYEPFGNPLNPSYVPSYFSDFGQRMTFWQRLQNTLLTSYVTWGVHHYVAAEVDQVEKYLGRRLTSMRQLYDDVSLILVNSHHSLNDIRPTTPDIIEVGGLHVVGDDQQLTPELQAWLDASTDGCVMFSFGSMVQIESLPRKTIEVFYEAFGRIAPVRVLIKILDTTLLPPGLPKNVKTAQWLPQIAVLKHKNVKMFITHGGLMGTQEAVAYKVPMIGLPLFADQYMNIQSYVEKKIAIALNLDDTLTAESLTAAVKEVLTDPTYRNNIDRISKLFWDRPMSAVDTAVYWVEYTARHGKILKSPATELTWWQLYLLDVYGFILLSVLILSYIITKIAGYLFRLACSYRIRKDTAKNLTMSKKHQ